MKVRPSNVGLRPWQRRLHTVIFEAETPAGKTFDVLLLVAILLSVLAVVLESVAWINLRYRTQLRTVEWVFTILFTIEYVLRLICVAKPLRYVFSFYGIVDLLAVLPTYLIFIIPGAQELAVIRGLRLLRIFRIFKLGRFMGEAEALKIGLLRSRAKITVFLATVLISVTIMGALMHLIEGGQGGFTDIPQGIYWAIVTMTTVGFGDITPTTLMGKFVASVMMVFGYSLIIIPTGIISAEFARDSRHLNTETCPHCMKSGHEPGSNYCNRCGGLL